MNCLQIAFKFIQYTVRYITKLHFFVKVCAKRVVQYNLFYSEMLVRITEGFGLLGGSDYRDRTVYCYCPIVVFSYFYMFCFVDVNSWAPLHVFFLQLSQQAYSMSAAMMTWLSANRIVYNFVSSIGIPYCSICFFTL